MSLFDHFRKEELPFVERALEMLKQAERKQTMRLTDFLDPRQREIVQSLASQAAGVRVEADGGYDGAERARVLMCPEWWVTEPDDFGLAFVEVKGDQRFLTLQHRDVLGALLGIGLKREKFGDILMDEQGCQFVVAREVLPYVLLQVTEIHHLSVELTEVPRDQLRPVAERLTEKAVTVPSLRVDALLGEVWHLSRAKVLVPIRAGKCKVNWKVVDDPSHQVQPGDVLSLRGFGRFRILDVAGPTRSGRLRVVVGLYA